MPVSKLFTLFLWAKCMFLCSKRIKGMAISLPKGQRSDGLPTARLFVPLLHYLTSTFHQCHVHLRHTFLKEMWAWLCIESLRSWTLHMAWFTHRRENTVSSNCFKKIFLTPPIINLSIFKVVICGWEGAIKSDLRLRSFGSEGFKLKKQNTSAA